MTLGKAKVLAKVLPKYSMPRTHSESSMKSLLLLLLLSLQSCPTLCDPIDGSPPGSPVPGILQARTLEWVDAGKLCFIFYKVAL